MPRGAGLPSRSTATPRSSTHTRHSSGPHCSTMLPGSHGHAARFLIPDGHRAHELPADSRECWQLRERLTGAPIIQLCQMQAFGASSRCTIRAQRSSGTGTEPGGAVTAKSSSKFKGEIVGEPACRPGSVPPLARGGGHPSGTAVAGSLVQPTREHRTGSPQTLAQGTAGSPLDLAPGGVYRAAAVTCGAGGLLHRLFTLTSALARGRSVFCGTVPRVTPGRRYRPPCPVEPGPSSPDPNGPARPPGRLTHGQDTRTAASAAVPRRIRWPGGLGAQA